MTGVFIIGQISNSLCGETGKDEKEINRSHE